MLVLRYVLQRVIMVPTTEWAEQGIMLIFPVRIHTLQR